MYNSEIRVTVPVALIPPDVAEGSMGVMWMTPRITNLRDAITVSQRGGVNFGDADTSAEAPGNQPFVSAVDANGPGTITIDIDNMQRNDEVRVFYENIDVGDLAVSQAFAVETDTNEDGPADYDGKILLLILRVQVSL